MRVNAQPYTVIGVLPASYRHIEEDPDRSADVFLPFGFDPAAANRGGHFIRGVGPAGADGDARPGARRPRRHRRPPGAGVPDQQSRPDGAGDAAARVDGGWMRGAACWCSERPSALVLLIACANLANLLLAAGASRQREFAVRAALGAGRRRLIGQLLAESLVLSALGGVAGLALAAWGTRAASLLAAAAIPRTADIRIDGTVLAFVALTAVVAAGLFGLAPALHLSSTSMPVTLKEGGRTPGSFVPQRVRDVFMGAQVALAVVLLVAATLLVRSLWRLQDVAPGFSPARVTAMDVSLPIADLPRGDADRFLPAPAGAGRCPAWRGSGWRREHPAAQRQLRQPRHPDRGRSRSPTARAQSPQARSVTPGYFAALGVPLLRGRLFDGRDAESSPPVVVISDTMARRYWPGEDPVGRRITFNSGIPQAQQQVVGGPGSREVIGIVGDVRHLGLDEEPEPMFYTPHTQQPSYHTMTLVVRTAGDVPGLAASVRAELRADGRRRAAVPGAHRRPGAVARRRPAAAARLAAGAVRRARRRAGGARRLRRGELPGAAAHARDRRADGAGRKSRRCADAACSARACVRCWPASRWASPARGP